MKKLKKLTLNEMQEFTPIPQQEQLAMKGGGGYGRMWVKPIYIAWKLSQDIYNAIKGSGGTGQGASPGGSYTVGYGADSVKIDSSGNVVIYAPDSTKTYTGSR